jgi:hypothetical protein
MLVRVSAICGFCVVMLGNSATIGAQTAAPSSYTITANNSMAGPGAVTKTYRLGSKALVDQSNGTNPKAPHTRTLYDLQSHRSFSWYWPESGGGCSAGTFSGDWGDPYTGDAELVSQGAQQVGTETLHGMATKILETPAGPSGKIRAWEDPKTGMIVKAQMIPPTGAAQTMVEVTGVSKIAPPTSVFNPPASCAVAVAAPAASAEADEIGALTGGDAQNFVKGTYGPGSKNTCTMIFRVVHAVTMESITSGLQIAIDPSVATEKTPSYIIGMNRDGHATFSGGGLHEVTSQMQNGVLRLDNIPVQFDLETEFGAGGAASANIYRHCFSPQTVLLYVVKNPDQVSDGGDWLWVKAGKYASVPQ